MAALHLQAPAVRRALGTDEAPLISALERRLKKMGKEALELVEKAQKSRDEAVELYEKAASLLAEGAAPHVARVAGDPPSGISKLS